MNVTIRFKGFHNYKHNQIIKNLLILRVVSFSYFLEGINTLYEKSVKKKGEREREEDDKGHYLKSIFYQIQTINKTRLTILLLFSVYLFSRYLRLYKTMDFMIVVVGCFFIRFFDFNLTSIIYEVLMFKNDLVINSSSDLSSFVCSAKFRVGRKLL